MLKMKAKLKGRRRESTEHRKSEAGTPRGEGSVLFSTSRARGVGKKLAGEES
jgi:hypothetical protein